MHTDHGMLDTIADLGNGQGRCVGRKDALLIGDLRIKLCEQSLLCFHVLQCSLYHKINIHTDIRKAGGELGKDLVGIRLLHLALGNAAIQILLDLCESAVSKLLLDIAQKYLLYLVTLCKCLRNAGTHGARTDNSYLHSFFSSW